MKARIIASALLLSASLVANADAQALQRVPAIDVQDPGARPNVQLAQTTPVVPPPLASNMAAPNGPVTPPVLTPAPTSTSSSAQSTTPPAPMYPPPPVKLHSKRNPKLTARERREVELSNDWAATAAMPGRGDAGRVVFTFGATLPSVVCAPLFVCAIELEPGETVNNIDIGDQTRWKVTPAASGSGAGQTTSVIIKPTDADLLTDLIITTDKRTYVLKLVSRQADWMSRVSFTYPEDQQAQWAAFRDKQKQKTEAETLPSGQNIENLDFNFRVKGDKPVWTPLRVYSDGTKTYIQFPPAMESADAPALVALADDGGWFRGPTKEIVNYRVHGDTYVVDKVLSRAALISGVGSHQEKVEIIHGKA